MEQKLQEQNLKPWELRNMEIQHAIYNAEPKRAISPWLFDKYEAQFRAVADEASKRAYEWHRKANDHK